VAAYNADLCIHVNECRIVWRHELLQVGETIFLDEGILANVSIRSTLQTGFYRIASKHRVHDTPVGQPVNSVWLTLELEYIGQAIESFNYIHDPNNPLAN